MALWALLGPASDGYDGARSGRSLAPKMRAWGEPFSLVIAACPPP